MKHAWAGGYSEPQQQMVTKVVQPIVEINQTNNDVWVAVISGIFLIAATLIGIVWKNKYHKSGKQSRH